MASHVVHTLGGKTLALLIFGRLAGERMEQLLTELKFLLKWSRYAREAAPT